jgi:hypothetical protein
MQEEHTEEQLENSKVPKQLQPYMYKKGQSGNPSGRPEGISLKEYVKRKFRLMTDEEREFYLEGINKKDIWEMAEDKASSNTDITSGGEKIHTLSAEERAILDKLVS